MNLNAVTSTKKEEKIKVSKTGIQGLEDILKNYEAVFGPLRVGIKEETGVKHSIGLVDHASPINIPPHRIAPLESEELDKQLEGLLRLGFIKPSSSAWLAQVLLVPKKPLPDKSYGRLRTVMDCRALNRFM